IKQSIPEKELAHFVVGVGPLKTEAVTNLAVWGSIWRQFEEGMFLTPCAAGFFPAAQARMDKNRPAATTCATGEVLQVRAGSDCDEQKWWRTRGTDVIKE